MCLFFYDRRADFYVLAWRKSKIKHQLNRSGIINIGERIRKEGLAKSAATTKSMNKIEDIMAANEKEEGSTVYTYFNTFKYNNNKNVTKHIETSGIQRKVVKRDTPGKVFLRIHRTDSEQRVRI